MLLFKSLPLYLVLLTADATSSSAHLLPRAVEKFHGAAVRHTRNLARDLRVAFSGYLVAQSPVINTHTVYCKSGKSGFGGPGGDGSGSGDGGSGNDTNIDGTSSPSPPSTTSHPSGSTNTSSNGKPAATPMASPTWKLVESHQGRNFFDGWNFHIGGDPTHGAVNYVDQNTGRSNGILDVNSAGNAIMRVETTPNVPTTRQSIRITTVSEFTGGLLIMDSVHMPAGCGTWPAFWSNGPDWPTGGEIDIVEAVHDYTNNQMTIHTNPGCRLPSADANALKISGGVIGGTDCAAETTGNQGCGIRSTMSNSFGAGFNRNGGGTYAMQWDAQGIAIYFFPRGSEPADIANETPRPETWGLPQARWPASTCDPFKYFYNHHAIFDTTLCGDWAGAVWNVGGIPGQEQTCAQRTGVATCEEFIRANGAAMSEAYWEVKYMKRYQWQS